MSNNFQHFGAKPVALIVGPDEAKLNTPRDLLSQIPYFAQAFTADGESESQKTELKFPDLDHKVLSDVIELLWRNTVPYLNYNEDGVDEDEVASQADARVAACTVAHRLALHDMQKKIENQTVRFHQFHHPNPTQLITLHEAGLRDSFLYKFLVAELSYDSAMKDGKTLAYPGCMEACARMPKEMLLDLLVATGQHVTKENRPSQRPL